MSKIPEVTLGFWIIKIFATTLGEVGGNEVTLKLGLGYLVGSAIFGAALLVVLGAQIKAKRFHPFLYWAVITATTLAGTTFGRLLRSLARHRLSRWFPFLVHPSHLNAWRLVLVTRLRLYRNRYLA